MQSRKPSTAHNWGTPRQDALNEALERLSDYRYHDGIGFACHGSMAAEALSSLGFDDEVPAWVERYKAAQAPIPAPPPAARLDFDDRPSWRTALGDPTRVSDWEAAFANQLQNESWQDILRQWTAVLLPGYAGGLTHGLLRVAHCTRSLPTDGSGPSQLMLTELSRGLALWASSYTVLPGRPSLTGRLQLPDALRALPRPDQPWSIIEAGSFARMEEVHAYPDAVAALGPPASIEQVLSDLSETFSGVLLAFPEVFPIPLVHTLTPVAAVRALLPYLPSYSVEAIYAQLWQVNAAIITGFTPAFTHSSSLPAPTDGFNTLTPGELAARAAECGDAHAIKFTEAALREHSIRPSDVYLRAAQSVLNRIPRS